MSVYTDLLFMHGHIANVELARQLAGKDDTAAAEGARDIGKMRRDERGHEPADAPARAMSLPTDACSNR
ncbi:MAG: hypothetical protein DI584_05070 [Stenotrophomonas sp.]|jgi:hypothetical protein|nr:MAG: hypothetical protein DI584_05070 [Stenotrophomonas sp.]